jgi:hypothetical protein
MTAPWPRDAEDRVNDLLGQLARKELDRQRLAEQVNRLEARLTRPAPRLVDFEITVTFSPNEYVMLGRIVDEGMWELASSPHTKEDAALWDAVCEKLRLPAYERGSQ